MGHKSNITMSISQKGCCFSCPCKAVIRCRTCAEGYHQTLQIADTAIKGHIDWGLVFSLFYQLLADKWYPHEKVSLQKVTRV